MACYNSSLKSGQNQSGECLTVPYCIRRLSYNFETFIAVYSCLQVSEIGKKLIQVQIGNLKYVMSNSINSSKFLALDGELTPIMVQMVKSANTNGLLDNVDEVSTKYQNSVKRKLHEILQRCGSSDSFTNLKFRIYGFLSAFS